jgi:hypothetical protein
MKQWHWLTILAIALVAYLAGVKYPSYGQAALTKVGM